MKQTFKQFLTEQQFTGFNEWRAEISESNFGNVKFKRSQGGSKLSAFHTETGKLLGVWEENSGEGFVY